MKNNRLRIIVQVPIHKVFLFTITPPNSTRWIPNIIDEKTNEWPVRVGTVYTLQNTMHEYSEVTVAVIVENTVVEWISKDHNYHCRYTFTSINKNITEFVYDEWVNKGDLDEPFTQEILDKLKTAIEQ